VNVELRAAVAPAFVHALTRAISHDAPREALRELAIQATTLTVASIAAAWTTRAGSQEELAVVDAHGSDVVDPAGRARLVAALVAMMPTDGVASVRAAAIEDSFPGAADALRAVSPTGDVRELAVVIGRLGSGGTGDDVGLALALPAEALSPEAEELVAALAALGRAVLSRTWAVRALEEAERQRQAFFGVVSHELRTPITTIYGGTRVLRQSGGRLSHDAREQLLDDVGQEAERLYRLVEDLLVLSRAEREALVVAGEPILLQHLASRVAAAEQQRRPRARIRFEAQPGLQPVLGDSTLVEQVLRNLVSNAAKYAGDAGPITVQCSAAGPWIEVRVLDEGPGVDEEELARVFDLFYRGPKATNRAQGAGIGLYACRELICAMGGEVWVANRPGGGAEFGFRLRVAEGDEAPPRDRP